MYVLTEEYNQYDQYGEYFVAAWFEKPSRDALLKLEDITEQSVDHILNGGGRIKHEDHWYNLFQYTPES